LRDCRAKDAEMRSKRGLNGLEERGEEGEEEDEREGEDELPFPKWFLAPLTRTVKPKTWGPVPATTRVSSGKYHPLMETEGLVEDDGGPDYPPGLCQPCGSAAGLSKAVGVPKVKMPRVKKDKWKKQVGCLVKEEKPGKTSEDQGFEKFLGSLKAEYKNCKFVEVMVDSGAAESVMPPGRIDVKVTQGKAAKEGVKYTAADGGEIPNLGEQEMSVYTEEGHQCGMKFQVADVQKPLLSVGQVSAAGNVVEFFKTWGRIVHKDTGRTISFKKKGGVYVLKLWVDQGEKNGNDQMPFQRQEKA